MIEGLLSREGEYFFLEMNTRIQVEHTVTEMATGLDLVREQVLIAAGEPLSVRQEDVRIVGHAIEQKCCRTQPQRPRLPRPQQSTVEQDGGGVGVRSHAGWYAGLPRSGNPLLEDRPA